MRKTGVDRFSESPVVRVAVVLGWFIVSTIAFFSRYERWTPSLAALMVAAIVGIGAFGLTWAVWPAVGEARRRRLLRGRAVRHVLSAGRRPASAIRVLRGRRTHPAPSPRRDR
ncbi:MAG: hypothetical protein AAFZ87_00995 [Planctomycetota bacterium]